MARADGICHRDTAIKPSELIARERETISKEEIPGANSL